MATEAIDASKIEELARTFRGAVLPAEREAERKRLDDIANGRRYGNVVITGESGAHRDDAIKHLEGHGSDSLFEYFYGSDFPRSIPITARDNCMAGLHSSGIPPREADRLLSYLEDGEIPKEILDTIISEQERIRKLHPDKYPWHASVFDKIARGISASEDINPGEVWESTEAYLINRGMPRLAEWYRGAGHVPEDAITVLLQDYALAVFHDIGELDLKGKHF